MRRKNPADDAADRIRMMHMLDAARDAIAFSIGRTRDDLDTDRMLLRALVHCVQEIGEAAARIGEPSRLRAPSVPWRQIVGMRHRLVHVYFDISSELLWEVIARELRPLVESLETALAQWPPPPDTP